MIEQQQAQSLQDPAAMGAAFGDDDAFRGENAEGVVDQIKARGTKNIEPDQSYSPAQIVLHWLIAVLVLAQLIVNDAVRLAFQTRLSAPEEVSLTLGAGFHIGCGLLILALTLVRLVIRLFQGAPPPPQGGPALFEWMGMLAHWGLYALLFAMTLSGAAAWFIPSAMFGTLHETLRLALIALILLHILGALVEHYAFGNRVMRRMGPKL